MKSLTERQRADAAYFDQHWTRLATTERDLIVPDEESMYRKDLGCSLRYVMGQLGDLRGKRVLELGCGTGEYTVLLARRGAEVTAVDLSRSGLAFTQRRARANAVSGCVQTAQMPAEGLAFHAATFDWVLGFGILHHAEPSALGAEVERVLRTGGHALFREPLGLNPVLQFARAHVPYRKKLRSPGDRFLDDADLAAMAAHFSKSHSRAFYLFSMVSRAIGGEASFAWLYGLDEFLLARIAPLRRWCRYVVLEYAV